MSKKKLFLAALALALVMAITVFGTLAYLTASSNDGNGTKNTFIAAGGGKILDDEDPENPTKAFEIVETEVKKGDDGTYTQDEGTTKTGIEYEVMPGDVLPKDAAIRVVGKTDVPVYLFLEVVDTLSGDIFEDHPLEDMWMPLKDAKGEAVIGKNGGNVYVYATGEDTKTPAIFKAEDGKLLGEKTFGIVKGNVIKVKSGLTDKDMEKWNGSELTFFAYMCQANAGTTPAEVFVNCGFAKAEEKKD